MNFKKKRKTQKLHLNINKYIAMHADLTSSLVAAESSLHSSKLLSTRLILEDNCFLASWKLLVGLRKCTCYMKLNLKGQKQEGTKEKEKEDEDENR